jgi:hypothetical protein
MVRNSRIWCVPISGENSSCVMRLPTNHFQRRGHEPKLRYETRFSAVLEPRASHGRHQLPVGQHCGPDLLRTHANDGSGCRFSLGPAVRRGDGQTKSDLGSAGLLRLISCAALAVVVFMRRSSRLAHFRTRNRILDLVLLSQAQKELQSDWIVSYCSRNPPFSEWPFPISEGEVTTTTAQPGGLHEDSILPVSPPVI